MSNYKIKVNISIEASDIENTDGNVSESVERFISKDTAYSIDGCEDSVMDAIYDAARNSLSKHMSEVSKKKPKK